MKTLIITQKEVKKVLTPSVANDIVEKAFRAYGLGQVDMPAKSYITFKKGDLRAMLAYIHGEGFDIAGIKSVNVHPENGLIGLPSVMAVVILTDPETGFPLAILDGTYLTTMRTGAAGAVAAKFLSRKDAEVGGFVGCGVQARSLLACTMEVRPIKALKVWQRNPESESTQRFCQWAQTTYKVEAVTSHLIDDITTGVDILFTTTPSRQPIVNKVSPGTHINAIGADAEGKQKINLNILKKAKLIIDNWKQASHSGEINVPVGKKRLSKKNIYAELGEIAAGKKDGRTSDREITLFDSTGLAIQDISCAFGVYMQMNGKKSLKRVQLF